MLATPKFLTLKGSNSSARRNAPGQEKTRDTRAWPERAKPSGRNRAPQAQLVPDPCLDGGGTRREALALPSTVVVAVVVHRFFLSRVDDYGDDYGLRLPPVFPFSLRSPTPTLSFLRDAFARPRR